MRILIISLGLMLGMAGDEAAQTVSNGQQAIPCAANVILDTSYTSGFLDLNCAVASVTIPPAFGGKPYSLTILMDGGSLPDTMPGMSGNTIPNSSGYSYFRLYRDVPSQTWVWSKVGMTVVQGPKGDTGAQGIQGIQGLAGPQGAVGAAGAKGDTGATGSTGATGAAGASGSVGSTGATGATGPAGMAGATGAQGNPGVAGPAGVLYYGASGALANVRCYLGVATSTTNGTFTLPIATAGLTTLLYVNPSVKIATGTATGSYNAYILNTSTATTINGIVTAPATLSVLGTLSVSLANTAQTVQIEACGT